MPLIQELVWVLNTIRQLAENDGDCDGSNELCPDVADRDFYGPGADSRAGVAKRYLLILSSLRTRQSREVSQ